MAQLVGALEASLADLPEPREEPSGVLRVTATADIAAVLLAEAVARFTARHPRVTIEVVSSMQLLDLARDQIDLALRVARGELRGATLITRRIGTAAVQLFASPAYLGRVGTPRNAAELASHELIAFRKGELLGPRGPGVPRIDWKRARVVCDDMFFAREAARHGAGIALLPSFLAEPEVASGSLVTVLPKWQMKAGTMHLVSPTRKHVPLRVSAFRDLLLEMLKKRAL